MAGNLVEVDAEIAPYLDALTALAASKGLSGGEMMQKEGRLMAVSFARSTQPYQRAGDDKGTQARAKGEVAVIRDLSRVYSTPGDAYKSIAQISREQASAFYYLHKSGEPQQAAVLLSRSGAGLADTPMGRFDKGDAHKSRRGRRGRVTGDTPSLIVTQGQAQLRTYARKRAKMVGFAKACFARAASILGGTRGIPQWVTRHKAEAPGDAQKDFSGWNPYFRILATLDYIGQVLSPKAQADALQICRNRIIEEHKRVAAYEAKKAGFNR